MYWILVVGFGIRDGTVGYEIIRSVQHVVSWVIGRRYNARGTPSVRVKKKTSEINRASDMISLTKPAAMPALFFIFTLLNCAGEGIKIGISHDRVSRIRCARRDVS